MDPYRGSSGNAQRPYGVPMQQGNNMNMNNNNSNMNPGMNNNGMNGGPRGVPMNQPGSNRQTPVNYGQQRPLSNSNAGHMSNNNSNNSMNNNHMNNNMSNNNMNNNNNNMNNQRHVNMSNNNNNNNMQQPQQQHQQGIPSPQGMNGNNNNPEIVQLRGRVASLEEQIHLLKQQSRLLMTFMQTADEQITTLKTQVSQQTQVIAKLQSNSNNNNNNNSSNNPKYTPFPNEEQNNTDHNSNTMNNKRIPSAGRRAAVAQANKQSTLHRQASNQPKPEWNGVMDTDDHEKDDYQEPEPVSKVEPSKAAKLAYLKKKPTPQPASSTANTTSSTNTTSTSNNATRKPGVPSSKQPAYIPPPSNYVTDSPPIPTKQPTRSPSPLPQEYPSYKENNDDADFLENVDPNEYAVDEPLDTCPHCERQMRKSALRTHVAKKICQKQRKTFDMRKQRVEGVLTQDDIRQLARKEQMEKKNPPKEIAKPKKDWKAQHLEFQQAMKCAKTGTAPPPSNPAYDTRIPCPHCSRRFEENAAIRHIPHCKNTVNKPAPPPTQVRAPVSKPNMMTKRK